MRGREVTYLHSSKAKHIEIYTAQFLVSVRWCHLASTAYLDPDGHDNMFVLWKEKYLRFLHIGDDVDHAGKAQTRKPSPSRPAPCTLARVLLE